MYRAHPFLGRAFALSIALHAAVIAAGAHLADPASRKPPRSDLTVWLEDRAVLEVSAQPALMLPQDAPRNANAAAPARTARPPRDAPVLVSAPAATDAGSPPRLSGEAARRAAEQLARELPYPPEAIERGLQGEALVLIFLDPSGNAIAARLETSSGHALLDDAAVRAARTLHALPASAPREALLPVRFRLR
ncbi:MAG TPA: energy transducer TonB [Burkholderiales bacterium]|nr:energy transducer TonB [Burkholderiales bacterium]